MFRLGDVFARIYSKLFNCEPVCGKSGFFDVNLTCMWHHCDAFECVMTFECGNFDIDLT